MMLVDTVFLVVMVLASQCLCKPWPKRRTFRSTMLPERASKDRMQALYNSRSSGLASVINNLGSHIEKTELSSFNGIGNLKWFETSTSTETQQSPQVVQELNNQLPEFTHEVNRHIQYKSLRRNAHKRQKRTVPLLSPSKTMYIIGETEDRPLIMIEKQHNKLIIKVEEQQIIDTDIQEDRTPEESMTTQSNPDEQKNGIEIKTQSRVPYLKNLQQQVRARSAASNHHMPSYLAGGDVGGHGINFFDEDGTFSKEIRSSSKKTNKKPTHSFDDKDGVFIHDVDSHGDDKHKDDIQIPAKFLYLYDKGETNYNRETRLTTISINLTTIHDVIDGAKLNLRIFNNTKIKAFYLTNVVKSFKVHLRRSLYDVTQIFNTKWLTIDFSRQLKELVKKHGNSMLLRIQITSTDRATSLKQRKETYVKLAIKPPKTRTKRHKDTDCALKSSYLNLSDLGLKSLTLWDNKLAIRYCVGKCNGKNGQGDVKCCVPSKWGKREEHTVRIGGVHGIMTDIFIEKNVLECECR
ncbi:uncharacterized protein [Clytia hemisphaerica]|uniref:TGF-beta family profile domain-containing protein n=1 Tax=Clytia hemisphaerica TaxID=252671 RepID=A0A7M5V175_9CNID